MRKFFLGGALALFGFVNMANAQYSGQRDASYLAIVKAVSDYKIYDEEEERNLQKLREDQRFNEKLNKMIGELQNTRSKNSKNKKVLKVLLDAGKEIDDILNVN